MKKEQSTCINVYLRKCVRADGENMFRSNRTEARTVIKYEHRDRSNEFCSIYKPICESTISSILQSCKTPYNIHSKHFHELSHEAFILTHRIYSYWWQNVTGRIKYAA